VVAILALFPIYYCYRFYVEERLAKNSGVSLSFWLKNFSNLFAFYTVNGARQEGYLVIRRRLAVVGSTIIEDQFSIVNELVWGRVLVGIQFLFHRRQVHRFLDNRVIVGDFFFVDGLHERPGGGMVLHFGEDHLHGGKVRGSFGSSSEFVHFRSPSRFLYSLMTCSSGDCTYARDGEGVNRDAGLDVQCWVYEFRVSDLFDTS
jgi:hypothetical protein